VCEWRSKQAGLVYDIQRASLSAPRPTSFFLALLGFARQEFYHLSHFTSPLIIFIIFKNELLNLIRITTNAFSH
jgi:hypothetical protein